MTKPIFETSIKSLPFLHRGKVRDLYAVGDDKLLVVQSDRLSAFDVILPDPIPGKGEVLTALVVFLVRQARSRDSASPDDVKPESVVAANERDQVEGPLDGRSQAEAAPDRGGVRGYIIGSGWKDYQDTGAVCGIKLPPGSNRRRSCREPIFTPASKAPMGEHDENISFETR
jgi:phosphoribosylaminoimidazole-succinocarboxamide synthase